MYGRNYRARVIFDHPKYLVKAGLGDSGVELLYVRASDKRISRTPQHNGRDLWLIIEFRKDFFESGPD
jgi:hypothetical protein